MKLDNLRTKKLNFQDSFIYLKEILFYNFANFSKLLGLWILFTFVLLFGLRFCGYYLLAFFSFIAYIVFYLFYLAFISQSRAVIDKKKLTIKNSFKEIFKGFLDRNGLDLVELIPLAVVVLLVMSFPSSIFAVPLAFIITLATVVYVSYTILAQPVMVIKKMKFVPAIRYSTGLISGYFAFVLGLIMTLIFACLIVYLPFSFIKMPLFCHQVLFGSFIGIEVMLFAILLSVIYTNLEVAWSVGFKQYSEDDFISDNSSQENHEFTELFNSVPEVEIKEDDEAQK